MLDEKLKKSYLPMTETAYYILLSLTNELHGYGIILNVKKITDGRISLQAGTVYNTLSKLQADGLIQVIREEERKTFYKATADGILLLKAELARLAELYYNGSVLLGNSQMEPLAQVDQDIPVKVEAKVKTSSVGSKKTTKEKQPIKEQVKEQPAKPAKTEPAVRKPAKKKKNDIFLF